VEHLDHERTRVASIGGIRMFRGRIVGVGPFQASIVDIRMFQLPQFGLYEIVFD
jgi:hypothetical protein